MILVASGHASSLQIFRPLFWMTRGSIYRRGRLKSRLKPGEAAWHVRGAHRPVFSESMPSLGSIRSDVRIDQESIQLSWNLVWTFFNMYVSSCKNFIAFGSTVWKIWSIQVQESVRPEWFEPMLRNHLLRNHPLRIHRADSFESIPFEPMLFESMLSEAASFESISYESILFESIPFESTSFESVSLASYPSSSNPCLLLRIHHLRIHV